MTHTLPTRRRSELLAEADAKDLNDPNAMALATAAAQGRPSLRMVLLRGLDSRGFTFFTNYESRKGEQLLANPNAALCFHWKSLRRSVRVEGAAERVTDEEIGRASCRERVCQYV